VIARSRRYFHEVELCHTFVPYVVSRRVCPHIRLETRGIARIPRFRDETNGAKNANVRKGSRAGEKGKGDIPLSCCSDTLLR
jgi:hypothetical protein